MRSLLLTQIVPNPPDAGPKAKTHYVLRTLAAEHDVDLITFARSDLEVAQAEDLAPFCRSITAIRLERQRPMELVYFAKSWARRTPFLVERDARGAFAEAVRRQLATGAVDIVHADQLTMGQYLDLARGHHTRRVFDAHNAVWEMVRELAPRQKTPVHRALAAVEWRRLRRFEGRIARESDLTLAVSERDRAALELAAGTTINAAIVPIGIEVHDRTVVTPSRSTNLLSIATMHYPPNAEALRWFLDEVWPLLGADRSEMTVDVAGPRPPEDIVAAGERDPRVRVHGYVEDVEPLYQQAAVFIVPLLSGSGVRVKILEAMARGVPVVSTTIGADGLDLDDGVHLLIADTPAAFADAVTYLLEHPERAQAMAVSGRERILERYDWRSCCRPLLDAYRQLSGDPAGETAGSMGFSIASARDVT
ncbi:MAG TPA: glycosyltransferase family 4 protein [Thermomicrobiales bacterium]|nr:glycosyltransferase family 4 protein [Thermomicrobiales bacterium]